jgi:hypothetical protein
MIPRHVPSADVKKKGTTGKSCPSAARSLLDSERKLQSHLSDAGIAGVSNLAEVTTIDVTAGIGELSMIEDVENLCAKLQRHPFADPSVLVQGQVPIVGKRVRSMLRALDKLVNREERH